MGWSDYWNLAKGWFGYSPEQKVGKDLGGYLGQLGSEYIPIPGINGRQFGEWAGSFLPFKEGGRIGFNPQRDTFETFLPMRDMVPFKAGGRVFDPRSVSNILQQMRSETLSDEDSDQVRSALGFKKGGRVKKRKH